MKRKNRFMNIIKKILITIIALIALVYATVYIGHKFLFKPKTSSEPIIDPIGYEDYKFGVKTLPEVNGIDEFINVYANQIKRYGEIAPEIWEKGAPVNQYSILEEINDKRFWLVSPSGEVTEMTESEALEYNFDRLAYVGGFNRFVDSNKGIEGIYIAISKDDLNNHYRYDKYLHLGTYDPFITYSHELFHMVGQDDWAKPKEIVNRDRDDRTDDREARVRRYLIIKQLMDAIGEPEKQDEHIKRAIATYNEYKTINVEDYKAAKYFDKIEGTAYYYEIMTSLYSSYSDRVNSFNDIERAISSLMSEKPLEFYVDPGAVSEAYTLGGFAGILLDRVALKRGEDPEAWKTEMIENGESSPMDYLTAQFTDGIPLAETLNESEYDEFLASKEAEGNDSKALVFEFLYDILYK